ncbi:restriction endonuclease [Natroniella sulfidigena]|uniref:restriction endonuclease n=1 Tax=Natroniella sulfidigena TaxID=723921 RepID=UPI00200AF449|nr:restriction endonuclease [Natroniella sulfidigena]MCK8818132.1 restriction endonuclease [Natroniella sulfidigena]
MKVAEMRKMNPIEFEHYVADMLEQKGYDCYVTSGTADYGADIIAEDDKEKIAVQVKRYAKNNSVGVEDIYPVHSAINFYECDRAMIITTATSLTNNARVLARNLGIEVWDSEKLAQEFSDKQYRAKKEEQIDFGFKQKAIIAFWILAALFTMRFY